jgi:predicted RND superfamily exporter protein
LAGAKKLIDAREMASKISRTSLIQGKYPTVDNVDGMQVIYTGVIPVVYKAQRTLLTSLVESIVSAFIMISLVMMVVLNPGRFPTTFFSGGQMINGIVAGAVSMLPNLFPIVIVFGLLGILHKLFPQNFLIDIGTMMTASVAMGIAVDDTIHFLSWFRQNLDAGLSRIDAIIETYRRVGPAMTQTTLVGGLGLFVFALSTFTPTQRFGTLMLVLLGIALIGDLVLLPALLAGPLGRFFVPREVDPTKANTDGELPSSISDSRPQASRESFNQISNPASSTNGRSRKSEGDKQLVIHPPNNKMGQPHHSGRPSDERHRVD